MSKRTTLVLAILLLAALLAFVFGSPEAPEVVRVPKRFVEFTSADVGAVEVRHDTADLRLERDGDAWWVRVEGRRVPAAPVQVEALLHELEHLEPVGWFAAGTVGGAERTTWELDIEPRARVVLEIGGRRHTMSFHAPTMEGANVYSLADGGGDVFIVPIEGQQAVQRMTLAKVRRRTAIDFPTHEIAALEIARRDGVRLHLRKADALTYDVTEPYTGRADPVAVENLLARIVNLEALEFVEDGAPDWDRYGLRDPWASVRLRRDGRETPIEIHFGDESGGGGRYFRIDDLPTVMSSAMNLPNGIAHLEPATFRDRYVMRLGNEAIERIEFARGADSWALAKVGDRWDLARPDRLPAAGADVEELLESIRNLKAEAFLDGEDPAALGLDTAETAHAVLRLVGFEAIGNRTLAWTAPDDAGRCRARVLGGHGFATGGPVVLVDGDLLGRLAAGWLQFRERTVWSHRLSDVRGLERRVGDRSEAFVRQANGVWAPATEGGPAPDQDALTTAVAHLLAVEAGGWVTRASDAAAKRRHGVGDPPTTGAVTLVLRKDGETNERRETLLIGTAVEGANAHNARRIGSDDVFLLPDALLRGEVVIPVLRYLVQDAWSR